MHRHRTTTLGSRERSHYFGGFVLTLVCHIYGGGFRLSFCRTDLWIVGLITWYSIFFLPTLRLYHLTEDFSLDFLSYILSLIGTFRATFPNITLA